MGQGPASYNLSAVFMMIGGIEVTGFGDGDVITFTHPEDLVEPVVGADGEVVMSGLSNDHMMAEIILQPTSAAYTLLYQELVAQHPATGAVAIEPLSFICRDTINGETVSSPNAVFLNRPEVTMGKTVGERVFRLFLPDAGRDFVPNELNLV